MLTPAEEKSISEKQLAANRANAPKSTGPKSEAGKKRSALNSMRHGLTAQVTVMTAPDREAQEAFCRPIIEDLKPASRTELQLAQAYATLQWRINRVAAIEENVFTLGNIDSLAANLNLDHPETEDAMCQAKTFLRDAGRFNTLSLYGQRLVNQAGKVMQQLTGLQTERKLAERAQLAARENDIKRAVRSYWDHVIHKTPFDPQKNGFVCSLDEIYARIRRDADLEDERTGLNKPAFPPKSAAA
jgi:hypothetical protein